MAESVEWAQEKPVFKHTSNNRYIFYGGAGSNYDYGWAIGTKDNLASVGKYFSSKYVTLLVS